MSDMAVNEVYSRVLWRIIPLIALCYVIAYIDRSNIGLAKLQFMHDLHMPETVYGIAGGTFYLGYALFGIPASLMLARYGARATLLVIMTLWGLFSAGLAFITTPGHFYILRLLIGAAEAGFLPGVLLYLSRWVPQARRARSNALFLAAIPVSGVIGGPLGGAIMSMGGLWEMKGWQLLFLIEGIPACILGLTVFLALDETPAAARWLTQAEKDIIAGDMGDRETARIKAAHFPVTHTALGPALRDSRFYALVAMAIAAIVGSAAIGLWLPTIIQKTGIHDVFAVGVLSAVPYAVAIAAQYIVARSSDRTQERRWHSAGAVLVAAAGWCLLPLTAHAPFASLVLTTLIACGTFAVTGPFWAMPTQLLLGTAAAGGLAAITTISGIAAFFSPLLVGWLNDLTGSLTVSEYYYAVVLVVGATWFLLGTGRS